MVEFQHYVELEDMVHMAIMIENQVKRRGSSNTRSTPSPRSSTWKSNQWRKEEKPSNAKPKIEQKQEVTSQGNQGKSILSLIGIVILNVLNSKALVI